MSDRSDQIYVFDLDDTLYQERDYVISGFTHVSSLLDSHHGRTVPCSRMMAWWEEGADVFGRSCEELGLPATLKDTLLWAYRLHFPVLQLAESVQSVLAGLGARSYYIITDGRSVTQRNKMLALGVQPRVAFISEEIGSIKPHSVAFDTVAQQHPDSRIIYVADNPVKDFVRPNELGWLTIGLVDHGWNIHPQDPSQLEDRFLPKLWIDDFGHLENI